MDAQPLLSEIISNALRSGYLSGVKGAAEMLMDASQFVGLAEGEAQGLITGADMLIKLHAAMLKTGPL